MHRETAVMICIRLILSAIRGSCILILCLLRARLAHNSTILLLQQLVHDGQRMDHIELSAFFLRAVLVLSHSRARTTCSRNEHIYIPQCLGSIIIRTSSDGCCQHTACTQTRRNEIFRRTQNLILHSNWKLTSNRNETKKEKKKNKRTFVAT